MFYFCNVSTIPYIFLIFILDLVVHIKYFIKQIIKKMYSPTNEFSLRNDGGSKLVKTAARQWALYCSLCSSHLAVKLYDVRRVFASASQIEATSFSISILQFRY